MINATINDPTAKNQASDDSTKVGTNSVATDKSAQSSAATPTSTATLPKAPVFNTPATPPNPITPTPVEFNKGIVGGNLNKLVAEKPELKNTEAMDSPTPANIPPGSNKKTNKLKKKNNVKMVAGVFALLLLVVGAGAGLFLSQQPQDLRQQAYTTLNAPRLRCGAGYRAKRDGSGCELKPLADTTPVDPDKSMTGEYGECVVGGVVGGSGCEEELAKSENNKPADPNVQIRGTYVSCESGTCQRFVIDLPATHAASVDYAVTHGDAINLKNTNGNGESIELAPYKRCDTNGNVGYNEVNCDSIGTADSDTIDGRKEMKCPEGASTIEDGCYNIYYLGQDDYHKITENGETWVSSLTGCNDGVHDNSDSTDYDPDFPGDCETWHWTTCLDEGSGVQGWGCGDETPPDGDDPPPTAPPTTPPTGEPMCKDVAVLEDGIEIDPATASFSIGMVLQFRCAADDPNSQVTNYEFQVTEPDGTVVDGAAINPAGTSATSLEYQISQYLEHQVQCRICTSDGCQEWMSIVQ